MSERISHAIAEPWEQIERALAEGLPLTTRCGEVIERIKVGRGGGRRMTERDCPACHPRSTSSAPRRTKPARDDLPHYVYRLFDESGRLLYVGMTYDPRSRRLAHKSDKPWWDEVASWRLTIYPNRAHALRVEARAILTEDPAYNIRGRDSLSAHVAADPHLVKQLLAFEIDYALENGSAPSAVVKKREALRLIRGGVA